MAGQFNQMTFPVCSTETSPQLQFEARRAEQRLHLQVTETGDEVQDAVRCCGVALGRRKVKGLALLAVVIALWVGSSELTKAIYVHQGFSKPFFLIYLNLVVFCLCLVLRRDKWLPQWRALCDRQHASTWRRVRILLAGLTPPWKVVPRSADKGYGLQQYVAIAANFTAIWFLANFMFSVSLKGTSVHTNVILSSTSSLFTMLFGFVLQPEKRRHLGIKLLAVVASITGVSMIVRYAPSQHASETMWGDLSALLAAALYACYLLYLEMHSQEQDLDYLLLLGLAGVMGSLCLWPLFLLFDAVTIGGAPVEAFELPGAVTLFWLCANALVGSLLSELMWLEGFNLTSPLLATLSLTLCIPLSMLVDILFWHGRVTARYAIGTFCVVTAFVITTLVEGGARLESTAKDKGRDRAGEHGPLLTGASQGLEAGGGEDGEGAVIRVEAMPTSKP